MNELAYYNEFDAYSAEWLRNLSGAGLIAPGVIDERSISDVLPTDLRRFTQCHFFAGIGIWSAALRAAGWPDDWPVWTGSCPCQPFSCAGKGGGFADERHLWPHWFWLISHSKPDTIFGEQVTSADEWVDLVRADLEGIGYAFGCVEIPSAGFGAANIRARTYWVAHANGQRKRTGHDQSDTSANRRNDAEKRGSSSGMGDTDGARLQRHTGNERDQTRRNIANGSIAQTRVIGGMGDSASNEQRRDTLSGTHGEGVQTGGSGGGIVLPDRLRPGGDLVEWVYCRDEKWRPIEPGTLPLAPSDSSTVGRLRAYGNAINLRTATEFVRAYMECVGNPEELEEAAHA